MRAMTTAVNRAIRAQPFDIATAWRFWQCLGWRCKCGVAIGWQVNI
jgi:hypothetical protein